MNKLQTHNFSDDRHGFRVQLPYDQTPPRELYKTNNSDSNFIRIYIALCIIYMYKFLRKKYSNDSKYKYLKQRNLLAEWNQKFHWLVSYN